MKQLFTSFARSYRYYWDPKITGIGNALFLLVASFFCGVLSCSKSGPQTSAKETASGDAEALAVVAVVQASRQDLVQTLTMSGEFRPYQQVALHARVGGYLHSISVDTGDHVKEGQEIARLDAPELKSEFEKAVATRRAAEQDIVRAQSVFDDAHLSLQRLSEVAQQYPKLVAQQEIDVATTRDSNAASGLAAAQQRLEGCVADENKVHTLIGYTTITAPFDGVITRRHADPGALIQAGNSSSSQVPLVELAEDTRLRLAFPVPESAVAKVREGTLIRVSVPSLQEKLSASVSRFSGKIDRATRTMLTEADISNGGKQFKPGMVAEVTLVLSESKDALTLPVQSLLQGETSRVFVVGKDGVIQERTVQVGLQTPMRVEALEGIKEGELVLVGSRAGIHIGQKVAPKIVELLARE